MLWSQYHLRKQVDQQLNFGLSIEPTRLRGWY
jgi:hypothetical protein